MQRLVTLGAASVLLAVAALRAQDASTTARLDAAFKAFWGADTASTAGKAVPQLVASGASFDAVLSRLKRGRAYTKQRTGRIEMASTVHGLALDNIVEVPSDYDPAQPIPLRVSLQGGVTREPPRPGEAAARPLTN